MPAPKPPVPTLGHILHSSSLWGTSLGWCGGDTHSCIWNKGNQTPTALGPGAAGVRSRCVAEQHDVEAWWLPEWWLWAQGTGTEAVSGGGCSAKGQMLCRGMEGL